MPGWACVEEGQPQCGPGDRETCPGDQTAGAAVPGAVVAPEAGHELERAYQREHRGTDDVDDEGGREAGEPVVGRYHGGSAGELDEPERAGRERDSRTAPSARPGPASSDGGRPAAGWSSGGELADGAG